MGSDYKACFTPITIKNVEFKNRIVCTPNIAGWGSREGILTQEQIAYYERIARGGPALLTIGNCSINMNETSDEVNQLDLSQDKVIFGLNVLREKVERYNAQLSAQINYTGRNGWWPGSVHYAPSPIPAPSELERAARQGRFPKTCHEIDEEKLHELIEGYVAAAVRLKRAGFKVIMIHCAHNNLIGQFFSPISNFRRDQYGGSLENRARFGLEILQRIRKAVGNDTVIDLRMSGEDVIEGGLQLPEAVEISKMLEPYADIFTISCAFHNAPQSIADKMSLCMYYPQMPLVEYTKAFRKELKKAKIVFTTSVVDLDNAEFILENDIADFVGMFRPFLADPDIVNKYSRNKASEVNRCIRCEYHGKFIRHMPMTCAVNPLCGRELEFPNGVVPKTDDPKKILIVGGGPSGMQAALTAAQRGHEVVLYEKEDRLGGNLYKAAELPFKKEICKFIDYIVPRTMASGAKIVLGTEVTPEIVEKEAPDVLILAAGAEDVVPPIPGVDGENVHFCYEADAKKVEVGDTVVVIGAGHVGMETAMALSGEGKKVTVVERDPEWAAIRRRGSFGGPQESICRSNGVRMMYGCEIENISDGSVRVRTGPGRHEEIACDTVLLAAGTRPRKKLVESLRHCIAEGDVYQVGDLTEPSNIGHATNTGFDIAAHL